MQPPTHSGTWQMRKQALEALENCTDLEFDEFLLGWIKRLFPGCVKFGEKVVFCLPSAGRNMQIFHPLFTQPGKSL